MYTFLALRRMRRVPSTMLKKKGSPRAGAAIGAIWRAAVAALGDGGRARRDWRAGCARLLWRRRGRGGRKGAFSTARGARMPRRGLQVTRGGASRGTIAARRAGSMAAARGALPSTPPRSLRAPPCGFAPTSRAFRRGPRAGKNCAAALQVLFLSTCLLVLGACGETLLPSVLYPLTSWS